MKNIWKRTGKIAFWLSWPLLFVLLPLSRRTRILVTDGKQVLVVKGWLGTDRWSLPGGGVRWRELSIAAAVRELREETGIKLPEADLRFLGTHTYHEQGLYYTAEVFVARLAGLPQLGGWSLEIIDRKWLEKNQLSKEPRLPHIDTILNSVLK